MVDKDESDLEESQNVEEELSADEDDIDGDEENDVDSEDEDENEEKTVTKNGSNKRPIQISGSEVHSSRVDIKQIF
jgi:hypothetical protein